MLPWSLGGVYDDVMSSSAPSCLKAGCTRPPKTRGYCKPCYVNGLYHGTISLIRPSLKRVHILSNIDSVTQNADCANCGRVRVRKRIDNGQWVCLAGRRYEGARAIIMHTKQTHVVDSCEICGKREGEDARFLCYDHCHETGMFRGTLCDHCNKGIGMFHDKTELLHRAVEYLHRTDPSLLSSVEGIPTLDLSNE